MNKDYEDDFSIVESDNFNREEIYRIVEELNRKEELEKKNKTS